jgi:hypothetical protein
MKPGYIAEIQDSIENPEGPEIARKFDGKGTQTIGISNDQPFH